jgi:hypothetical protein
MPQTLRDDDPSSGSAPVKPLIISCLSAGIALAIGLPVGAVPRPSLPSEAFLVRVATDGDFATKKDEYMRGVKREMSEWNAKLHRKGEHAERDVDQAWTKTKEAAQRLQTASADRWDRAKHGFEDAMQGLKDRWHRIHPEDE